MRLAILGTIIFVSLLRVSLANEPTIVSVTKIWDHAPHNAFTDLVRFRDQWWCTFREANDHGPSIGKIRVIVSANGDDWTSAALVQQDGVDLRDPKLSIMPDGRLLLIMGGSIYREGNQYGTRAPRASFSMDGKGWTKPKKLLAEDHWLWRVTWQDGWAWSVSKLGEGRNPRRGMLYRSRDALDWEWITEFRLPNNSWNASETTLRFMPDGEMIALTRPHWIGTSRPPYTSWSWTRMKENIGGPNFIRLPDGSLWAAGRRYGEKPTTALARMTRDSYEPVLTLPSGGDCSYPGLVWNDGLLWMSYYSSHEGKTSIYLAKIKIE
ncbi:MAG TPA: sialidase family protein [Pirellulaceae bacterium]|nr:sialidase family protein [Pirellulaceae bacterium]